MSSIPTSSILKIGVSDETRHRAILEALRTALGGNDDDALATAKSAARAYLTKKFAASAVEINKLPTLKSLH